MARHPEVFVRDLSIAEGQKLQKITRTARDPVKLRRAIVVLMSAQGQAVGDIVDLMRVDEGYVRDVIHAFNERGFDALNPKWSGGRPPAVDEATRRQVIAMAKADPRSLGLPFTVEPVEARRAPGAGKDLPHLEGDAAAHPAHSRCELAEDEDVEGLHRPAVPGEDAPDPGPVRPSAR